MKKILLTLLLFYIVISSAYAKDSSISGEMGPLSAAVVYDVAISEKTTISIPIGTQMKFLESPIDNSLYVGILSATALNEYIPNKKNMQIKFGYGLYLNNVLNSNQGVPFYARFALSPVLLGEVEYHFDETHSLYARTTPSLFSINYNNGIKFYPANLSTVYDYLGAFQISALLSFSIGYRYSF